MYLDIDKAKETIRRNVLFLTQAYGNGNPRYTSQPTLLQERLLDVMTECVLEEPEVAMESKVFALDLAASIVALHAPRWHETHTDGVKEFVEKFSRVYVDRLNLAKKLDGRLQKDTKLFSEQTTPMSEERMKREKDTVTVVATRSSSSYKP